MNKHEIISIEAIINAPIETVWERYTKPEYITQWNFASDDWHCPRSENDPRTGGRFNNRMEAKDGSFGFDFEGTYDEVRDGEMIAYTIGDRKVQVYFVPEDEKTKVVVDFEAEDENSLDMQRDGWQAILDNFNKCAEA